MSSASWWAEQLRIQTAKRDIAEKALELAEKCGNGVELPAIVESVAALYKESLQADPASRQRVQATTGVMSGMSVKARSDTGARIFTGIPTLDSVTRGISEGEVLTIVARPQVGKSALATQITLNAALRNERCVFFSLEMPREQTISRLLQQATGVDDETVETWARAEWKGLAPKQVAAISAIQERIVVIDRGRSGMDHLEGSMNEAGAVLGGAPRLAVIDFLGLVAVGAKNLPLYQRVSEAAMECKSFAKRYHVALILLSQAGRDQDPQKSEGAGALGLDAGRDSGMIEEDADCLLTMWRPELSSKALAAERTAAHGIIEAHLVKNRRRNARPRFRMMIDAVSTAVTELSERSE